MSGGPLDRNVLPRLAAKDVRLLWVNDWYDAPTEAVVEHEGARCLLRLADPAALDGGEVRWLLFPLTPEQLATHVRWHDEYVQHVGTHWCFHDEPHQTSAEPDEDERQRDRFLASRRNVAPVDPHTLTPMAWLDALPLR